MCDGPEAPTVEEKTQMKKQNSALLDNIEKKGKHSVSNSEQDRHAGKAIVLENSISHSNFLCVQYYYAHKPKEFSMENAKLIEGVGKTYGGTPVLLKTVSNEE